MSEQAIEQPLTIRAQLGQCLEKLPYEFWIFITALLFLPLCLLAVILALIFVGWVYLGQIFGAIVLLVLSPFIILFKVDPEGEEKIRSIVYWITSPLGVVCMLGMVR